MKDYYSILGVTRSSSYDEIRKTYRRLAVKYHPDKNSDPSAETLFKEINEAYDVIGDPRKRKIYDDRLDNPFTEFLQEEVKPKHRDPAYHRKKPAGPPRKSESQKRMELMASYLPQCRLILYFSVLFCFFLLMDFWLPFRTEISIIKDNYYTISRRRATTNYLLLENGKRLRIDEFDAENFIIGEPLVVYSTKILGVNARVEAQDGYTSILPLNIYRNFMFGPVLLFIFALAGILSKNVERIFTMAAVSFFVLLLCGVFLLISMYG